MEKQSLHQDFLLKTPQMMDDDSEMDSEDMVIRKDRPYDQDNDSDDNSDYNQDDNVDYID